MLPQPCVRNLGALVIFNMAAYTKSSSSGCRYIHGSILAMAPIKDDNLSCATVVLVLKTMLFPT